MKQVRWRSVYKSTSISWGVIKSLMKEVDWSSDLLLSCCCLLLPVMSSNGIQLTTGEEKYVHGRGGWGCNGAVCACVYARVDTEYWSPFVKDGVCLWGFFAWIYHICIWSSFMLSLNENTAKILQTQFSQVPICGIERDVWREAKGKKKKKSTKITTRKKYLKSWSKSNIQKILKTTWNAFQTHSH